MEKIVHYLERIGFTVTEQGSLANKYIVILKDQKPIGFIFADMGISLTDKSMEQDIQSLIDFINANSSLQLVGDGEYLIATYLHNTLTTYYDHESRTAKWMVRIVDDMGIVSDYTYSDVSKANLDFVVKSELISADNLKVIDNTSLSKKIIKKIIKHLSAKINK